MLFAFTHFLAVLFLVVLFDTSGALLALLPHAPASAALGAWLSRVTLGAIAWIALLFAFACVGLYRAAVVLPFACAVLAFGSYRALRSPRLTRASASAWLGRLPSAARAAGPGVLCALPALIVLGATFFQALSPHIGWDDNVYHLTLPKRYLAHGGFRPIPFSVYSHWPHAVELLYGLALMLSDQVLGKLVHGLFLGLMLLAVYRLARPRASRTLAMLATMMVLGNDVLLFEAPLAYIDIAFAFFFVAAVGCADEYLRTNNRAALVMSGLCCGAVAASKLSGFVAVLCVGASVLIEVRFARKRLREITLALLLPTLCMALPWYLKSWIYTGNPLYPFLYRQFGGIEWSEPLGRAFYRWQQGMGMGRSPRDYLLLPLRVVLEGERGYGSFDGSFGKFWLAAAPLALLASVSLRGVRVYTACACMYFVFWALSSQQGRFLIAVLPLFAIGSAIAADSVIKRVRVAAVRGLARVVIALAIAWSALPALRPFCSEGASAAQRLVAFGAESLSAAVPQGYAYVNQHLPRDAKLMLLNINRGFFLDRDYIADSFFEASQMNWVISGAHSQDELNLALRRLGITHIYVDYANWGVPYPPLWDEFLRDRRWVKREHRCEDGTCTIYRLRRL